MQWAFLAGATGFVSVRRTMLDGWSKSEVLKECKDLAPGVNYCQEVGKKGLDLVIEVQFNTPALTNGCRKSQKVQLKPTPSVLLLHHAGSWRVGDGEFTPFFSHNDFTVASEWQ